MMNAQPANGQRSGVSLVESLVGWPRNPQPPVLSRLQPCPSGKRLAVRITLDPGNWVQRMPSRSGVDARLDILPPETWDAPRFGKISRDGPAA